MIKPLGDRIVVRVPKAEEVTKGGIYLPDTSKDQPSEGEVLAVGPGKVSAETGNFEPLTVKVGDKILFAKFAGIPIKVEDEELMIMREDEVFAIAN